MYERGYGPYNIPNIIVTQTFIAWYRQTVIYHPVDDIVSRKRAIGDIVSRSPPKLLKEIVQHTHIIRRLP
jgi:hypothetical protein